MPWVRFCDNAPDHPKLIAIGDGPFRLWFDGNSYCQRHLTDGHIPAAALKGFRTYSPKRVAILLAALVPGKGPLWHRNTDGSVEVHDYLDWNDSREKVTAERKKSKDRYDRWRGKSNGAANGVATALQTASTPLHTTKKIKSTDAPRRPVEISDGTFALYTRIAAEARDLSIRQDDDESISNISAHFKSLCAARKLSYDSELAAKAIEAVLVAVARRSA
jgi:hypothetical protein